MCIVLFKMSVDKVLKTTEEERNAIMKYYGRTRTEKETENDIQILKDWLKKQPHLPQDEDETRLRTMLHYNKFSLEKTKSKLDMYYSLKHIVPEYYSDREPLNPQISNLMDNIMVFMPLPNLSADLNRVIFTKFCDEDANKFDIALHWKTLFSLLDVLVAKDCSLAHYIVADLQYIRIGHLVQITPVTLKKSLMLMQKSYSDKIKGIHIINLPPFAQTLVLLLNSILSEKMANRVHVHKDINSLGEAVSRRSLPNEYGGTAGPLNELYDNWKKYYKSQNDWLKDLGSRKSDESKRIGEPIDSDMFGMCGSFRKLNYD